MGSEPPGASSSDLRSWAPQRRRSFFLCFAAIFNGSWPLLLFFVLCYAAAGALGVQAGRVGAVPLALTLAAPAVPWVLWLFPASIPEAGLLRALLWPGVGVATGGLPGSEATQWPAVVHARRVSTVRPKPHAADSWCACR